MSLASVTLDLLLEQRVLLDSSSLARVADIALAADSFPGAVAATTDHTAIHCNFFLYATLLNALLKRDFDFSVEIIPVEHRFDGVLFAITRLSLAARSILPGGEEFLVHVIVILFVALLASLLPAPLALCLDFWVLFISAIDVLDELILRDV